MSCVAKYSDSQGIIWHDSSGISCSTLSHTFLQNNVCDGSHLKAIGDTAIAGVSNLLCTLGQNWTARLLVSWIQPGTRENGDGNNNSRSDLGDAVETLLAAPALTESMSGEAVDSSFLEVSKKKLYSCWLGMI